ncbi:MAG: hypothetical protein CMA12_07195 [Euryarchaeota archaeon]|nr:hypothetical protein [Euryarchaeota archaeon]MAH99108.1 hypothetical protein [Euryarchaeota archaeon]
MAKCTRAVILSSFLLLWSIVPQSVLSQDIGDSWKLEIDYPEEDSANPFILSDEGSVSVGFFVENSGLVEISVEFAYEVPFGGKHDAPEAETIPSGENKSFNLEISEIDVFAFEAEKTEKFSITATVTARQGVPDPFSSSQQREGDLEIPAIFSLSVDISEPFGPMNAGTDTILIVTVQNNGNAPDGVGEIEIEDDCPLMTSDNGLDSLLIGNIDAGKSMDAELRVSASESHPRRHCDISIIVTSKRSMNVGGNVFAEDEVRISVEPPPKSGSDTNNNEDEVEMDDDYVRSNIPYPGLLYSLLTLLTAANFSSKYTKRKK